MPLRAILDDVEIQSFNLDIEEWNLLKDTYKDKSLLMPCCPRKAIPKTSKLGMKYFAHSRRGDCTSAPETQEHLYLKFLVAKLAQQYEWDVTTEYAGSTPDGEKWVADVFCKKGTSKLAIEIQWSQQTNDEYLRRTQKYTSSGVRCAWLFRLRANKEYYNSDFLESKELPYFGFKHQNGEFVISRYMVSIEDFVGGMFSGSLAWEPKNNEEIFANIRYQTVICWACKMETNVITSVGMKKANNTSLRGFIDAPIWFTDKLVANWAAKNVPQQLLLTKQIGEIKERYSKTVGETYLSNGCVHCDALQGNHFISIDNRYYSPSHKSFIIPWKYSQEKFPLNGAWFFNGEKGEYYY
ncbi:hypothetical protein E2R68_08490 [Psychromonas sp. RZ22]|uniref:competence protein CoiA n=1 Tax=Psychromonas algarum TaxID=2555643 RepID=UPI0010672A3A|nr:competence protein CoiA family protein [Psychromonas sp. RZ22]TEW54302.1 hypothetical protein E2R68_08490 [Psychromonas sp. RZ22]